MSIEQMQKALLMLAVEMTSSEDTAISCMADMYLEDDEQLFDVAQYLKFLIYREQKK